MESFRWLLTAAGILLLLGVYLLYLLGKRYPHWFGRKAEEPAKEDQTIADSDIIYINLKSREGPINGADLVRAMEKYNLVYGDMNIYHRLSDDSKQPLFSIANMVKPGTFNLETLMSLQTPGITMFLQLPRTFDALHALDEMWTTAQNIARELDAELLDRNHQPLSAQKQQNMRDNVLEYQRQIALQAKIDEYHQ